MQAVVQLKWSNAHGDGVTGARREKGNRKQKKKERIFEIFQI